MPKLRGRNLMMGGHHAVLYRENRHGEAANALGACVSCLACLFGIIMVSLGTARRDGCKIKAIDFSSFNNPEVDGNLIKWFKYTGTLFILSGYWSCCSIGALPATMRTISPGMGGACADLMSGLFGKLMLFVFYIITLFCNIIGFFWLYMAGLARTESNSSVPGDVNYCTPEIWYTAHIVVNIFWIITVLGAVVVGAQIHRFFRGPQTHYQVIQIGGSKTTKDKIKMPTKRAALEGLNPSMA